MNKKQLYFLFLGLFILYLADVYYSYATLGAMRYETGGFFNATEIVRGFALLGLIIFFFRSDLSTEKRIILFFLFYYTFSTLITLTLFGVGLEFFASTQIRYISPLLKTMFTLLLPYFVFMYLSKNNVDEEKFFNYIRYYLLIIYVLPIFLSWLGIAGFYSYGYTYEDVLQTRHGYKGFIYGQNGLTATVIMIMLLFTYVSNYKALIGLFVCLGGGLLIGTKGFIGIGAFCLVIALLLDIKKSLSGERKANLIIRIIILIAAISGSIYYFQDALNKTYLHTIVMEGESGDTFGALTSGRINYIYTFMEAYPNLSMLQIVMGGMNLWMSEVDPFYQIDLYGLVGLLIYLYIIIYLLKIIYYASKISSMHQALALSIVGLISHSLLGGHVFNTAPTMTPAALVIGFLLYCRKKQLDNVILSAK